MWDQKTKLAGFFSASSLCLVGLLKHDENLTTMVLSREGLASLERNDT